MQRRNGRKVEAIQAKERNKKKRKDRDCLETDFSGIHDDIEQKKFRSRLEEIGERMDGLPDDIIIDVLCKLSSSAKSPSDFVNILLICKRFQRLALTNAVLSVASPRSFAVRAKNWSESAHSFLKLCADAGNIEACYFLGMIRFYCLQSRAGGTSLMARAAIRSHAPALYSLAVIQFNGSGGSKKHKDLRSGFALCRRAASLGHVDALRELGHCLQDGYGVRQNIAEGRRFLFEANAREFATALFDSPLTWRNQHGSEVCRLMSDFGCNVPAMEVRPVNRFLSEWFSLKAGEPDREGMSVCLHVGCGRPETRRHEFRRCSVCGVANYCSRACQALDWKMRHKVECAHSQQWMHDVDGDGDDDEDNYGEDNGEMLEIEEDAGVV